MTMYVHWNIGTQFLLVLIKMVKTMTTQKIRLLLFSNFFEIN
jgi:hypothetical protein